MMIDIFKIIVLIVASYMIGSIPFGLVLSKCFTGKDIRKMGSGNIGATNVLRSAGPSLGILTLALDIFKGFLVLKFLQVQGIYLAEGYPLDVILLIAGLSVFCGHVYSIFLKFKGGKGVAVALGVFLAINPLIALIGIGIFVLTVAVFRYVSLGSIMGTFSVVIASIVDKNTLSEIALASMIALIVIYRHKSNIKRMLEGSENKLFSKKTS